MKTKFGKTIAGVALLFCAYGAGGCHGDLDIMQDNKLSASNMWKEESDATSATYGLYVYLRSALKSMNDIYLCWGELRNGLWGPGTHNTLNGVDQSQVRTSTMSSVNEYADWTALYTTVNQANLVIRHVPAMGLKEKPRAFCLGNAHFIRAYCFFQIARIWGDAPLPLWGYESTDTELFLGRTPVSEVLMRVERDIADAERYVADTSDKTVATPAAVAMLKADYALWMYRMQAGGEAYLAMAQEALGELGLSDALLEPAYADIFSSSNKCGREVIFAVHQDVSEALNGPAYNFFKNGEMFRAYAGDLRFVDVDGDGIMTKGNRTLSNHGDLEIIGNQSPRYQYSINMSLNWNGIGLSMLWQGVGKRDWYPTANKDDIYGANQFWQLYGYTIPSFITYDFMDDVWSEQNPGGYFPRLRPIQSYNGGPLGQNNDRYLQSVAYLRFKNLTIGYTLPVLKKYLSKLRIYVSGENLCYWSPLKKHCKLIDPELAISSGTYKGGTGTGYTMPRTFSFGVDITF